MPVVHTLSGLETCADSFYRAGACAVVYAGFYGVFSEGAAQFISAAGLESGESVETALPLAAAVSLYASGYYRLEERQAYPAILAADIFSPGAVGNEKQPESRDHRAVDLLTVDIACQSADLFLLPVAPSRFNNWQRRVLPTR